jgi:sortase (surface protein transpeptidase)
VNRISAAIHHRGGRQGLLHLLALTAAVGGVVAIIVALTHQQSAPQPSASAAGHILSAQSNQPRPVVPRRSASTPKAPPRTRPPAPPVDTSLQASVPVAIDIPAIDVHSRIIPIGKAPDGTLAVPQPGPDLNMAAWYDGSVTPGQDGPSVIEGHIDSVYGPSVFFQLGAIRPGDLIRVTRRDRSVVTFTANAVRSYPSHASFPTTAVYGGELAQPTLRLITCSNFDSSSGHYVGNTVIFAHLTAAHRGPRTLQRG